MLYHNDEETQSYGLASKNLVTSLRLLRVDFIFLRKYILAMNSTFLSLCGAVLLSSGVAVVYLLKHKRKKINNTKKGSVSDFCEVVDIPELPWTKVGKVHELFIYPLKSGKGEQLTKCFFDDYGILVKNDAFFNLRDRYQNKYVLEKHKVKFLSF